MITCLRQLGVTIEVAAHSHLNSEPTVTVTGCRGVFSLPPGETSLFVGNAGTAARFLTALLCYARFKPINAAGDANAQPLSLRSIKLHGVARMHQRPIADLTAALAAHGARIEHLQLPGALPLRITPLHQERYENSDRLIGGLSTGKLSLPGSVSSQYVSALLMAAVLAQQPNNDNAEASSVIEVQGDLVSEGYVALTVDTMQQFGVTVTADSDKRCYTVPALHTSSDLASSQSQSQVVTIEGDASAAVYPLCFAALSGGLVDVNVSPLSGQGDAGVAALLQRMGCDTQSVTPSSTAMTTVAAASQTTVTASEQLRTRLRGPPPLPLVATPAGVFLPPAPYTLPARHLLGLGEVDMSAQTDSFLAVAVVAAFAVGHTDIVNVANQRVKECDRVAAVVDGLRRLGLGAEELPTGVRVHGLRRLGEPAPSLPPIPASAHSSSGISESTAVTTAQASGAAMISAETTEHAHTDSLLPRKTYFDMNSAHGSNSNCESAAVPPPPFISAAATAPESVSAVIRCHGDHRVAMAFAAAGLRLPLVALSDHRCVGKTYPGFWDDINRNYDINANGSVLWNDLGSESDWTRPLPQGLGVGLKWDVSALVASLPALPGRFPVTSTSATAVTLRTVRCFDNATNSPSTDEGGGKDSVTVSVPVLTEAEKTAVLASLAHRETVFPAPLAALLSQEQDHSQLQSPSRMPQAQMRAHVAVTGMRGAGKTSLGRAAAHGTHRVFVDLDDEVAAYIISTVNNNANNDVGNNCISTLRNALIYAATISATLTAETITDVAIVTLGWPFFRLVELCVVRGIFSALCPQVRALISTANSDVPENALQCDWTSTVTAAAHSVTAASLPASPATVATHIPALDFVSVLARTPYPCITPGDLPFHPALVAPAHALCRRPRAAHALFTLGASALVACGGGVMTTQLARDTLMAAAAAPLPAEDTAAALAVAAAEGDAGANSIGVMLKTTAPHLAPVTVSVTATADSSSSATSSGPSRRVLGRVCIVHIERDEDDIVAALVRRDASKLIHTDAFKQFTNSGSVTAVIANNSDNTSAYRSQFLSRLPVYRAHATHVFTIAPGDRAWASLDLEFTGFVAAVTTPAAPTVRTLLGLSRDRGAVVAETRAVLREETNFLCFPLPSLWDLANSNNNRSSAVVNYYDSAPAQTELGSPVALSRAADALRKLTIASDAIELRADLWPSVQVRHMNKITYAL